MIEIDGSMGEGGGQILRAALGFSALLGVPVRIFNIRAKRKPPGLKPSHIATVKVMATITNARVQGVYKGSTEIIFEPRTIKSGRISFDIGTAGSITLVLQAVFPVAVFAPDEITIQIRGGTAVPMSPTIYYFKHVFLEALRRMNVNIDIDIKRMGYYPRGGGLVEVRVKPVDKVSPVKLYDPGRIKPAGIVFISNLPDRVANDIVRVSSEIVREYTGISPPYRIERLPAYDKGCGGLLYTIDKGIIGHDQLCKKGVHATKIGRMLGEGFVEELRAEPGVDKHLADHLVIRASIADGESIYRTSIITSHTKTQLSLLKIFLPEADVRVEGRTIRIRGIGLTREERLRSN